MKIDTILLIRLSDILVETSERRSDIDITVIIIFKYGNDTGSVLKVIKMLESNSLIILSQTCRLFNSLISQDFFIGISFPIDDEDMREEIIRKKILKLTINIEGSCTLLDVNWDNIYVDVLEMRKPMQQLQNFNVEETFEVSVIINFREGVVSPQPEYTYKYVGELIKNMKTGNIIW